MLEMERSVMVRSGGVFFVLAWKKDNRDYAFKMANDKLSFFSTVTLLTNWHGGQNVPNHISFQPNFFLASDFIDEF